MANKIISRPSELEQLQQQVGQITDESLESTRRMLNMMEESEEAGRNTIECLDVQREQLNHIEKNMDTINADMTKAEGSLRKLKSCCNICPTPWRKVSTQVETAAEFQNGKQENHNIIVDQPRRTNNDENIHSNRTLGINSSSGYIKRITHDAREDEMESNLCQVNSILGNLRNMAEDMNTELKTQNEQIERITEKGDTNNIRLEQVNISATKILNA